MIIKQKIKTQLFEVLLPMPFNNTFTYKTTLDLNLNPGNFVKVPFREKIVNGCIWPTNKDSIQTIEIGKVRNIIEKITIPSLPISTISFIEWFSQYNCCFLGLTLKQYLNVPKIFDKPKRLIQRKERIQEKVTKKIVERKLSDEQEVASKKLISSVTDKCFSVSLLDGVPGSGKTIVYLEAIKSLLNSNKQILVLVPEITLTNQFLETFQSIFGSVPEQWHSNLTPKQRKIIWKDIINGKVKVIVGARSALFLPFKNLGLIIVDEEHDGTFKQEDSISYNARDMAIVLAKKNDIPIFLVSATPSLETYQNAMQGKYRHIRIAERFGKAKMPDINLIDLRSYKPKIGSSLSPKLLEEIKVTIGKKEQAMLFLNRRGYAPLTLCSKCGFRIECPNCHTSWLVEHKIHNKLYCHHCGYNIKTVKDCPKCKNKNTLIPYGTGVEKIEEEIKKSFPKISICTLSSDLIKGKGEISDTLNKIIKGKIDLIIGTQILAKGHHFPQLTLVGVVDSDISLIGCDMRASEKTFQILTQVAGRSGREKKAGRVFLQTYSPDHPVIKSLIFGNRNAFFKEELRLRKNYHLPPFSKLASIIISGKNEKEIINTSWKIKNSFPNYEGVKILGPAPSTLSKKAGRMRWRLLIKSKKTTDLSALIRKSLAVIKHKSRVKIKIDIDPTNFY